MGELPERPPQTNNNANSVYAGSLARAKSKIVHENLHIIEYYLLKCSRGSEYFEFKNKIEIKELWKFTLIKMMEII